MNILDENIIDYSIIQSNGTLANYEFVDNPVNVHKFPINDLKSLPIFPL